MPGFNICTADGPIVSVASINLSVTGNPIAAVTGQIIRVYRLFLTTAAAGTLQFTDGTTNFTGVMTTAAGVPLVLPMDGNAYFTCGKSNPFTITIAGGAGQTSGTVYFTQQPI